MPRWYYKPAIIGFELQERGSTAEPKVFMEEDLTGQKHHVLIRKRQERPLDRPDCAEFQSPVLSDPHAVIEFTRDGRLNLIDKSSERGTFRIREGRNKFQPDVIPASIPLALEEGDVIQLGSFLPDDPISPMWLEIKPIYDRTPLAEVKNGQSTRVRKPRKSSQDGDSKPISSKFTEENDLPSSANIVSAESSERIRIKLKPGRKRKRVVESDDSDDVVLKRKTPPITPVETKKDASELEASKFGRVQSTDSNDPTTIYGVSHGEIPKATNGLIDLTVEEDMDISSSREDTPFYLRDNVLQYPPTLPSEPKTPVGKAGEVEEFTSNERNVGLCTSPQIEPDDFNTCELWLPPSDQLLSFPNDKPLDISSNIIIPEHVSFASESFENKKNDEDQRGEIVCSDNQGSIFQSMDSGKLKREELVMKEEISTNIPRMSTPEAVKKTPDVRLADMTVSLNGPIPDSLLRNNTTSVDRNLQFDQSSRISNSTVLAVQSRESVHDVSTAIDLETIPNVSDDFEDIPGLTPTYSTRDLRSASPANFTQTLPKGMANLLLRVAEGPEVNLRSLVPEKNPTSLGDVPATPALDISLRKNKQKESPLSGKAEVVEVKVFERSRNLAREDSSHTDVSSDLGDLRIHTNDVEIRNLSHRTIDSSPESSPGVDHLSPYLEHSNKLPRLRKYYASGHR